MSRTVVISGIVALLMLSGLLGGSRAKENLPRAESGDLGTQTKLTPIYFGVKNCRKCHGLDKKVSEEDALFYQGTEMSTWDQHDKHKDAIRVLTEDRGKQMARILGWDVTKARECISCHGVHTEGAMVDSASYETEKQRVENGVSCVVCHGAFREWVNTHAGEIIAEKGKSWKDLDRTKKKNQFGLANLWNPVTRAELCFSCHIGNAEQGKVVTHEMYAAGHPPLPGIEIVAFADAMPRHWRTFSEKIAQHPDHEERFKRNQDLKEKDSGRKDADLEQSRMLIIVPPLWRSESPCVWPVPRPGRKKPELAKRMLKKRACCLAGTFLI